MKVGDKVPVQIGPHTVAQATVKELGDGTATLLVPGTLVVMGTRTTLDDLPETQTNDVETLIVGVDRASGGPEESTTGNDPIQNNEATQQPVADSTEVAETVNPVAEVSAVENTPEPETPVVDEN